jgi:hypothetical protein
MLKPCVVEFIVDVVSFAETLILSGRSRGACPCHLVISTHHHIIKLLFIIPNKFANEESYLSSLSQIHHLLPVLYSSKSLEKFRVRFPHEFRYKIIPRRATLQHCIAVDVLETIRSVALQDQLR